MEKLEAGQSPQQDQLNYDPKIEEPKWQKFWADEKVYRFDSKSNKPIYSIDTPPPTVSGKMHLGHSFSYSQQDFIARYHRMKGENVYYPFGTDDNGLPTERLIEKLKNVKSTRMERHEFTGLCYDTLKEIKPAFIQDWINLGMSCDFDGSYSTIDPHCQKTSQYSFIDLFEKGRIFQEESPISWCTLCQTAIAQTEFEDVELTSHFNDIIFKVGGKDVIVATTRPELLPACVAVFVHPDDKRYKDLVGKHAKVPLFNLEVPILTDEKADPEKGTGVVMCCTFGDKTDSEWWYKHRLPLRVAITKDGKLNELGEKYAGLPIKEARKVIIEDMKAAGLLIRQQQITHPVNVHERCGTELEILKTKQWFIRILDKKEELIAAADKMTWYPEHMKSRYVHWVENLNWDWCISRQRYFGVPFPVWYCKECGKVMVADKDSLPVDPLKDKPKKKCGCGSSEFIPEKDVMDTWATSSVSPQIVTNWQSKGNYSVDFKKMYPMSLRPQAHDIIRTWAFYTIVKGIYNCGNVPWNNIMISGWALDPRGKKMSKSKGNVVDPQPMIDKYSADALRFWSAGSKLGDDLPFQEKDLVTGKKMVTKLWNASKFSMQHLQDFALCKTDPDLEIMDLWVLSKMQKLIKDCTASFDAYEYAVAKFAAEKFFWGTICDNYLEICKDRLYNPDSRGKDARLAAQFTLYKILLTTIKLVAPIMPHITESIYQSYFAKSDGAKSIHVSDWPRFEQSFVDEEAEKTGDIAVEIICAIRKFKSEKKVSLKKEVNIVIECTADQKQRIESVMGDIKSTCTAKNISFGKGSVELESSKVKLGIELLPDEKN